MAKPDVEKALRNKIEQIADVLDNPSITSATKILQLIHDCGIERSLASRLVNAGKKAEKF